MTPDDVERAAQALGLTGLGAIRAAPEHKAPDGVEALFLLALSREGWGMFTTSPEFGDGVADPLDRWSTRVVGELAGALDAVPLFPFGGPPYQPFLRWAAASGRIWPSRLGMSIHAEHGVWMSFRGALGFASLDDLPATSVEARPCDTCVSTPCLKACPVDAFDGERYDVDACAVHVGSPEGAACRLRGCLARRACWVGQDWVPEPERAAFHMGAFLRARAEA